MNLEIIYNVIFMRNSRKRNDYQIAHLCNNFVNRNLEESCGRVISLFLGTSIYIYITTLRIFCAIKYKLLAYTHAAIYTHTHTPRARARSVLFRMHITDNHYVLSRFVKNLSIVK